MSSRKDQGPPPALLETSRTLLGWDQILGSLSGFALSALGRERCRRWKPAGDRDTALAWLGETEALRALLETPESFPLRPFDDLTPTLETCSRHRTLSVDQGLAVLRFLELVRDLKRRLPPASAPPALRPYAEALDPLTGLAAELDRCLDPEEGVRESASPELKAAVKEAALARRNLDTTVRKLMGSNPWKDALQDQYATEREGRVVLPIRAGNKSRLEGIVHDSSGSGQTLFMEPSTVVPLNNQWKIARLAVEREKARVLARLAEQVLQHSAALAAMQDRLADLDLIHARARLAQVMEARPCLLTEEKVVDLRQARNPELVLAGRTVVANTLSWDPAVRVLIISGPNTGGKTVTLKTLGLMALMIRAGLLLPVGDDSRLGFFPEVYADIGDEQNIGEDLSTFSGHLKKIIRILDEAAPGALVLLDELGIATDPQQGAALAQAILLEMKERGLTTLVSTHYLPLKILAQTEPGFLNACTEFDLERLSPTYRLVFGAPGQSAALETAERLGLEPGVIRRAREFYDAQDHRAETLLAELTRQRLDLETQRENLEALRRQTQAALEEQHRINDRLQEKERRMKEEQSQKLQRLVRDARREIRKLLDEARRNRATAQLKKTDRRLQSLGRRAGPAPSRRRAQYTVPAENLKAGDEVLVDGYDAVGVLLDHPAGQKKVAVRLGNLTTLVETGRLFGHNQGLRTQASPPEPQVKIQAEPAHRAASTCDLRGMNLEEAREAMELFLSQAVLNKLPRVILVHGHGLGKIKQLVRDYLGSTGLCRQFGPAPREQGGDGATVVEF